jgi:hypothetical protein
MDYHEDQIKFDEIRALVVEHVAQGVLTFGEAREELRAISLRWEDGSVSS